MTRVSFCSLLLVLLATTSPTVVAKTATQTQQQSQQQTTQDPILPRRERNLDFMDAATLAYYLGVDPMSGDRLAKPGPPSETTHNVAVMFYAQRNQNSHYLAPAWDAIGTRLKAGTRKANLIMGLFDCELDEQHFNICDAAGVTHYPTLLFISPSRTFPHKPKITQKKPLAHTTHFPGLWQYDRSIQDWLMTMQAMSRWTAFWEKRTKPMGWWKAASYDKKTADLLPVGIPVSGGVSTGLASSSMGGLGGGSTSSSTGGTYDTAALKALQEENKQYQDIVVRSSILLDATLFPIANPHNASSTDLYAYLNATFGWDGPDVQSQAIRSCAMEIALDYCTRLTSHKTNELVALKTAPGAAANTQTIEELEAELHIMIMTAEPYCDIIETCIVEGGFTKDEACRPATCPFQEDPPCRYLSSCFDEQIQQDYATALGLTWPFSASKDEAGGTQQQQQKSRGWM